MRYLAVFACLTVLPAAERDLSDRFYEAVRNADVGAVRQLLQSGADVNTKDSRGGTPLAYAAAIGTPETLRVLIAAGADVNARTAFDATPLMWGTANLAKVRMLVEKGADVNARSKLGNTPVQIAAAQPGNVEVLRYLFAHGATIAKTTNDLGQSPLSRAAHANDLEMVKLLLDKGDPANTGGITPLMFAAANANVEMVKLLLAKGAEVNALAPPHLASPVKNGLIDVGGFSAVMVACVSRSPEIVRLLLQAGADVNAQDVRGMTPLMLAVASDHSNPEIVRMLLAKRPNLTLTSKSGDTAMGWAAKFQHPVVLPEIQKASGEGPAPRVVSVATERAGSLNPAQAAEKSFALMQKTTASFFREGGCVSCHAQHITGVATGVARSKGIRVDEAAAADVLRATRLEFASRADQFLERVDGPADSILTTALFALVLQDVPADRMTDAMIRNVASQQLPEGEWTAAPIVRPPTLDGYISGTALSIRVLRQYAPPALKEEMDRRISRATDWIVRAETSTTEDAVMQLLGAKWGGADAATLQRLTNKVLALQREGGGWAQTPHLQPDAYATATALYALHEGGGISPSHAAYQRGVKFLLDTQAADGSWHVATRAPRIQPYFESGFPYGHDQWISEWATGWATIALSLAAPQKVAAR
jgi:ankyrin repeat protein